jgi:hypothetical protein
MLGNIFLPVMAKMAYKVKVARRKRALGNISLPVRKKMAYKTPRVSAGRLWDDRTPRPSIKLDSPDWFAWLDAQENDGFSYALHNHVKGYIDGFMTVRKQRRQWGGGAGHTARWVTFFGKQRQT